MLPANERLLADLARRIDAHEGRIDRLETLEFTKITAGGINLIEDLLLTGSAGSITFGAALTGGQIPQIFKHLWIYASYATLDGGTPSQPLMTYNGDTGSNYRGYLQDMTPVTTISEIGGTGARANIPIMNMGASSNASQNPVYAACEINIMDYTNDIWKPCVWKGWRFWEPDLPGSPIINIEYGGGHWMNTAAITTITITAPGAQQFKADSRFTLYGLG